MPEQEQSRLRCIANCYYSQFNICSPHYDGCPKKQIGEDCPQQNLRTEKLENLENSTENSEQLSEQLRGIPLS